eukprot:m.162601 g.162601  ORF g.162601 m.162601 type:complete len:1755 (+) comp13408_c0_seq1:74-5338(+)
MNCGRVVGLLFAVFALTANETEAFRTGAPFSSCSDGLIPVTHGIPGYFSGEDPPFGVKFYPEYTVQEVHSVQPGKTYDIDIQPNIQGLKIGGFLLRDLIGNRTFVDIDFAASESDRSGLPPPTPVNIKVVCNGTGLTQSFTTPSQIIPFTSLKVTARAPNVGTEWNLHLSILSPAIDYYGGTVMHVPLVNEQLEEIGVTFSTNISIPIEHPQATFNVKSMKSAMVACPYNSVFERDCQIDELSAIELKYPQVLPTDNDFVYIVALSFLGIMNSQLEFTLNTTTSLGVPEYITQLESGQLLVCGIVEGRSLCQLFDPNSLASIGSPWSANGVISRDHLLQSAYAVIGDAFYSGHYQVQTPITVIDNDANCIVLSLLSNTAAWDYTYDIGDNGDATTNNGLLRSTHIASSDWIEQPSDINDPSEFFDVWTPTSSHPYVYIAFQEYTSDRQSVDEHSNNIPLIARICKDEPANPPLFNLFNSFVAIVVKISSTRFDLNGMSAAAHAVPTQTSSAADLRFYVAFYTHSGPVVNKRSGIGIGVYGYTDTHDIDHEMGGLIDPRKAKDQGTNSIFSCDRSPPDALFIDRVDNTDVTLKDDERLGYLTSTPVYEYEADNERIVDMGVHSFTLFDNTVIDILWVLESQGYVYKVPVNPTGETSTRVDLLKPLDTLKTVKRGRIELSTSTATAFVTMDNSVTDIPFSRCERHTSCDSCILSGDPYCGWCPETSSCSSMEMCEAAASPSSSSYFNDIFGRSTTNCPAYPLEITPLFVSDKDSTSASLMWEEPMQSKTDSNYETPMFQLFVDGSKVGSPFSNTVATVSSLSPYSSYNVSVRAFNNGGYSDAMVEIQTLESTPSIPQLFDVANVSANSIFLVWKPPQHSNGILLPFELLRNGTRACCSSTNNSFIDSNLQPATIYEYSLAAVTSVGSGNVATMIVSTAEARPGKIPSITTSPLDEETILVQWSAPPMLNGVLLHYVISVGGVDVVVGPSVSAFNVSGLEANTKYFVTVRAQNAVGDGEQSDVSMVSTLMGVAPSPSSLMITQSTVGSVSLSWNAPRNYDVNLILGYKVEASVDYSQWIVVYEDVETTANVDVMPCKLYYFRTSAQNMRGYGRFSFPSVFMTSSASIATPSAPVLSSIGAYSAVEVTMDQMSESCDFMRYVLEMRVDSGAWSEICCNGVDSTISTQVVPITSVDVVLEFRYAYEFNQLGETQRGSFSDSASLNVPATTTTTISATTTTATLPMCSSTATADTTSAPSMVDTPSKVTGVSGDGGVFNVTLSWNKPTRSGSSNIVKYDVFRNNLLVCCSSGALTRSFVDVGLQQDTSYSYRVRAWNDDGVGSLSNSVTVRTAMAAFPRPATPSFVRSTTSSITIAWVTPHSLSLLGLEDALQAQMVKVYSYGSAGSTHVRDVSVPNLDQTSLEVTGLSPGLAYTFSLVLTAPSGKLSSSGQSEPFYTSPAGSTRSLTFAIVQFSINHEFLSQYNDVQSSEYLSFVSFLQTQVDQLFGSVSGSQAFVVLNLERGSVVVTGNVTTEQGPPLENVVNLFQQHINNNTIPNIDTLANSFVWLPDNTCIDNTPSSSTSDQASSVGLGAGLGVLVIVLVVVIVFLVWRTTQDRKALPKQSDAAVMIMAQDNPSFDEDVATPVKNSRTSSLVRRGSFSFDDEEKEKEDKDKDVDDGDELLSRQESTKSQDYLTIEQMDDNDVGNISDEPNNRNSLMDTDDVVTRKLSKFNSEHTSNSKLASVDFSSSSPFGKHTKK